MSDIGYFSMYARFETESKEDAAAFLGADNHNWRRILYRAGIYRRQAHGMDRESFRQAHGHHRRKTAEKVDLCNAKGWNTVALLALVAFTEKPEPCLYWVRFLSFPMTQNMKSPSLHL